jgi:hypothetical protein
MVMLSQHVDTFKEALYLNGDYDKYNKFVNDMIELKEQAQDKHDINNDNRFVNILIGSQTFKVMATSIRGYSVVLRSGDLSIALKKKGDLKTDKNPSIKIEYRAQFLVNYGFEEAVKTVWDFISKYIHTDFISKIQDIHIAADTQGHSFTLLDVARFKTRSRKVKIHDGDDGEIGRHMVFSSRRMETIYFGGSNNLMRIYDKTKEISIHPESSHIQRLWRKNPEYDDFKDVWRIEFQVRRPILKQLFNKHSEPFDLTKVLLNNIGSLWDYLIKYFSYRDLTRVQTLSIIEGFYTKKDGTEKLLTKQAESKMIQRAEIHPLWKIIEQFKNHTPEHYFRFREVKASNANYAFNSYCSLVSTITKHFGYFSEELVSQIIRGAEARSLKNHEKGIVDRSLERTLDFFHKVEYQRKIGLEIVDYDESVKENVEFLIAPFASHLVENSSHQPIF